MISVQIARAHGRVQNKAVITQTVFSADNFRSAYREGRKKKKKKKDKVSVA